MVFQDVEIDLYGSEPLRQIISLFASRTSAGSPVDRMWVCRFARLPAQSGCRGTTRHAPPLTEMYCTYCEDGRPMSYHVLQEG